MPAVLVQVAEDGSQPKGMVDLLALPLYSLDIKQHQWPWVFEKGNPPALAILTLEALAVLAALWAYRGEVSRPPWVPRLRGRDVDRQERERRKLMTTKCSVIAVIFGFCCTHSEDGRARRGRVVTTGGEPGSR